MEPGLGFMTSGQETEQVYSYNSGAQYSQMFRPESQVSNLSHNNLTVLSPCADLSSLCCSLAMLAESVGILCIRWRLSQWI